MSKVGNETKADMKGAMSEGGGPKISESMGDTVRNRGLGGAMDVLKKEHPIKYDDLGPHHGGGSHLRHETLGGLKPTK